MDTYEHLKNNDHRYVRAIITPSSSSHKITIERLQNPLVARNKRIGRNRILEAIGWVLVACLLIGGAYIGIKKQDAINQERNV